MKKGCFIPSIIVLTIIIAAIGFMIQTKNFYVLTGWLNSLVLNEIEKNISKVEESEEKDSLIVYFNQFKNEIDKSKTLIFFDDRFTNTADSIVAYQKDGQIDSEEITKIKHLLNFKSINNERPTSH